MAQEASREVSLHIYDLSSGLAAQLSKTLLGKQVDGVWHTGVVFGGLEYYFGGGVQIAAAGQTPFGRPLKVLSLGTSLIPDDVFQEYMADLNTIWTPESYSLFENNCNHFSQDLALFLTGSGIPEYILKLPQEVLSTPFGKMMAPSLAGIQGRLNSPPRTVQGTPFETKPEDLIPAVTDSLRSAAATVVADTGMPLGSKCRESLQLESIDDNMKRLHEASQKNSSKGSNSEAVSSLGRAAVGRENTSLKGASPGPGMGFPAPVSRRLTTARSGEIITRLGSGQFSQSSLHRPATGDLKLPPLKEAGSRRQSSTNVSIHGPKEPKDGTRAEPGPSSARNVGINARVSYDLHRSNSWRSSVAKQDFEAKVQHEVAIIMAKDGASPKEAVAQAIQRASAVSPSMA